MYYSSVAFHALLLLAASLFVLGVALPTGEEPPEVIHAELGPVDRVEARSAGGPVGSDPDSARQRLGRLLRARPGEDLRKHRKQAKGLG